MTTTVPSACPLDCPDGCSLTVEVDGDRIVRVEGDRRNPLTQGFICQKVRGISRYVHGPERLVQPGLRRGPKGAGTFAPCSWDEALDLIAARITAARQRYGGESILPLGYGGSNGVLTQDSVDARLFYRLGASRLARTVCAAPSGRAAEGLYGKMPGVALMDYDQAKLIVLWGVNPSHSGIHLVPIIQRARKRGARLVVVDPRRTPLAKQADLHLPVKPGTDLPVALALIHWLFEQGQADQAFLAAHATDAAKLAERAARWDLSRAAHEAGIAVADLHAFANLYADSSPAVIRCGWGVERNQNGGSAVAAILALPAVAGKFGVRAGGYTLSNSRMLPLDPAPARAAAEPSTRVVNLNQAGRALAADADPKVHLLFVYNGNPLTTLPRQDLLRRGLQRDDLFTVVFDQVLTDTARYADVILPATTFLEHHELRTSYGAGVTQHAPPAILPVGEARPNYAVFAELCHRLGLTEPGDRVEPTELVAATLAASTAPDLGLTAGDPAHVAQASVPRPIQFVDVFPGTSDRRIALCPAELDAEAPAGLYAYARDPATPTFPLALISPAGAKTVSSTFGQLDRRPAAVQLHPDDAGPRGLAQGQRVRIYNGFGEVICRLEICDDVRRGVAMLSKGLWAHRTANGANANALCPDRLADLGGGATFNDARVQVEPASV